MMCYIDKESRNYFKTFQIYILSFSLYLYSRIVSVTQCYLHAYFTLSASSRAIRQTEKHVNASLSQTKKTTIVKYLNLVKEIK